MIKKITTLYVLLSMLVPLGMFAQDGAPVDVLENTAEVVDAVTAYYDDLLSDVNTQAAVFSAAQDTFYNNQTTANKDAFDQASIVWAQKLFQAQLDYIDTLEADLYATIQVSDGITADWLAGEREQLKMVASRLEGVQTYAPARIIVGDAIAIWDDVHDRVQQMRVYVLYDRYAVLVADARDIKTQLETDQTSLVARIVTEEEIDWQSWQQVIDAYEDVLQDLEHTLADQRARILQPYDWGKLDDQDELWQQEIDTFRDFVQAIQSLQTLQSQSIDRYLFIQEDF